MYRLRRQAQRWHGPEFSRKIRQIAKTAETAAEAGDLTEEQRFVIWTLQEELREFQRRAEPSVAMLERAARGEVCHEAD
jgi:hypothetical protein